jgi:hypothetical protein
MAAAVPEDPYIVSAVGTFAEVKRVRVLVPQSKDEREALRKSATTKRLDKATAQEPYLNTVPVPYVAGMWTQTRGPPPTSENVCTKDPVSFYEFAVAGSRQTKTANAKKRSQDAANSAKSAEVGRPPEARLALLQKGLGCLAPKILAVVEVANKYPEKTQFLYLPTKGGVYGSSTRKLVESALLQLVVPALVPYSAANKGMDETARSRRVLFVLRTGDKDYNDATIAACKKYAKYFQGNFIVGAQEHYASVDLKGVEVIHQVGAYDTKIRMQLEGRANRRCALMGLLLPWVIIVFAYYYGDDLGALQYSCDANSDEIYAEKFLLQREVEKIIQTQSFDSLAYAPNQSDEKYSTRLRRGLEEADARRRWAELRARRVRRLETPPPSPVFPPPTKGETDLVASGSENDEGQSKGGGSVLGASKILGGEKLALSAESSPLAHTLV